MQKKAIKLVVLGLLSTSVLNMPLSVWADELDNKITSQETKINEVAQQEQKVEAELKSVQTDMATIENTAIELATKEKGLNQDKQRLNENIEKLTIIIDQREVEIANQARAAQVNGDPANYLRMITEATSISEVLGRIHAVWTLISANTSILKTQEQDKKLVEASQFEIDMTIKKLNETILASEKKKSELQNKQLQQVVLQSDLAARRSTEEEQKNKYIGEKEAAQLQQAENERLKKVAEEQKLAEEKALAAATNKKTEDEKVQVSNPTPVSVVEPEKPLEVTPPAQPPVPTPTPDPPTVGFNVPALLAEAQKWIGTPYSWGGGNTNGPSLGFGEGANTVGFDCSSFVQYVFGRLGIGLPRTTYQQEYQGTYLELSQLQAGDLIFWGGRGSTHHVGIYMGGNQYIHAPETGDVVKISSVSSYNPPSFGVRVR
ncbi:NlpC/P60 family protein [Carnobacterium maltaromaticum]|uniref:C40 family peptidase n=1 Tax=Carnobacterium maltaromaticum TaxID=2751 RepID=UPI00191BA284|nr:NlpC/P60 family protein [Carnobacterium maltaromaticum]CAD5898879.1 NlpC/P60 family protein [Carnobacterium maltaromaticum]